MKRQSNKADIVAVARSAKVSISTVSRSFNHPHLVNPATRKKIDAAIKRTGYIRNRAAQAMHGRRSGTIGLIVPTINHAIFAEVIQSFSDTVEAEGFTILITSHGYDLAREYQVLRKLLEHRVDAVALIGLEHSDATYQLLTQQDVPALAIWNHRDDAPIACVGAANFEAGAMASAHVVALGHRKIAMVFPAADGNDRAVDRVRGVDSVLDQNGIAISDDWRLESPYSIAQAKARVREFLQTQRPTALICGNDVIAQGAMLAAQSLGIKVPQQLSITGIGDFKGSEELEPPLTTIRIPAEEIGQIAGRQITQMIAEPDEPTLRHRCAAELMVRGTTCSPPPHP